MSRLIVALIKTVLVIAITFFFAMIIFILYCIFHYAFAIALLSMILFILLVYIFYKFE